MSNARCLLLIVVATLASCNRGPAPIGGGRGAHLDAGAPVELWVHPQEPAGGMDLEFEVLPAKQVHIVDESKQAEAQQRLAAQAWSLLSLEEARAYVGKGALSIEKGSVVVLLRCVQPMLGDGEDGRDDSIQVKLKSGSVVVTYLALRNDFMPLRRRAIVAVLPAEPREVFVQAFTAIY